MILDFDKTIGKRSAFLIPVTVLTVTAAVYLPALWGGFVSDDADQIVLAHPRLTWHAIPAYFTSDVWGYLLSIRTNYYRPVFLVWLTINFKLFGLEPAWWHAAALAMHLSATLLFYFLARRLTRDRLTAGIAALLFGVHPVHVEAVAWLSGITEPLLAVSGLGAILCYLRAQETPQSTLRWNPGRWDLGAMGLFAVALLTKETAVVLPLLLVATEWLRERRQPLGSIVVRIAPYFAMVLIYLGARIHALGGLAPVARAWTPFMVANTLPGVLLFYLRQMAIPLDEYSFIHPLEAVRQFRVTQVVLPAAVVLVAAAALFWIARRGRATMFGVLLLTIPLLPVLNLRAFAFDDIVHDRYLYLPSAGLCVLLAMAIRSIPAFSAPRGRVPLGIAIVAVAGALSFVTVKTAAYWADDLTLYTRAVEVAPASTIAVEYLAGTLVQQQRYSDALPLLNRALALDMRNPDLYNKIAACEESQDNWEQAEDYLRQAIVLFPRLADDYAGLTTIDLHRNDLAEAESHMRQAMQLRLAGSPLYSGYHLRLGQILEREGNSAAALAEYQAELSENPGSEEARDQVRALGSR